MKAFGIVLLIIGGIWLFIAFNMNTVVSTGSQYIGSIYIPSTTVNNIGLMDERRNHLMMSALLVVVGVILFAFDSTRRSIPVNGQSSNFEGDSLRKCPYCAEMIQNEAIKCKHCGSAIEKAPEIKVTVKDIWEQAYVLYHKSSSLNDVLELYEKIIFDYPRSPEAYSVELQIKKDLTSKDLFQKAYEFHTDNNSKKALSCYKLVIAVFPDSPEAEYSKARIKEIGGKM